MEKQSTKRLKDQLVKGMLSSPIIYINHHHFQYVEECLRNALSTLKLGSDNVVEYDFGQGGIVSFDTKKKDENFKAYTSVKSMLRVLADPSSELKTIYNNNDDGSKFKDKKIFLLKGLSRELLCDGEISLLQSFATKYESGSYDDLMTVVIVSPETVSSLPISLSQFITVIDVTPPTVDEIKQVIVDMAKDGDASGQRYVDDMVRTLQGLQMYDVKQTLKTVLTLTNGRIARRAIDIALEEKKRIVKKSGIIEVIDTGVRFEDVGGLDRLQEDLKGKSDIYHNLGDAEKFNVAIPKGILIVGMPGCGKSMIAQATANLFEVSLLRLDVSRLMGKYVGESESNLRLALATAEAAHPCVLWIDEIEKAFAGSNNTNGDNDMLVMRMMGHFLTWMQERKTPVYIVATANDVMRPEFMRKGRFDEVYFVDFPNADERADILRKKISKRFKDSPLLDFSEIGDCMDVVKNMKGKEGGFSGAEIECVLNLVVEEKFTEYLNQKRLSGDADFAPSKIKVTKTDFDHIIDRIKDSAMANQVSDSDDKKNSRGDKTPIERIRNMQNIYNFTNATSKK